MLKLRGTLPKVLMIIAVIITLLILTDWKHTAHHGFGGFIVGVILFLPFVGIIYFGLNLIVALNVFMFDRIKHILKSPN